MEQGFLWLIKEQLQLIQDNHPFQFTCSVRWIVSTYTVLVWRNFGTCARPWMHWQGVYAYSLIWCGQHLSTSHIFVRDVLLQEQWLDSFWKLNGEDWRYINFIKLEWNQSKKTLSMMHKKQSSWTDTWIVRHLFHVFLRHLIIFQGQNNLRQYFWRLGIKFGQVFKSILHTLWNFFQRGLIPEMIQLFD